jgi:hypothetical protein
MSSEIKEMTDVDYNSIRYHLANKEVVLFLGPLFGMDEDENKISTMLRDVLTPNFNLDDEFENLFILQCSKEKIDNGDLVNLRTQFGSFYESQTPHKIYRTISQLKFKAVINCSQDLFLRNAFRDTKTECLFYHFSAKSAQPYVQENGQAPANDDKLPDRTVVYNVYGSYEDQQSLITDYETFYNFLIALIGANQEIPTELKKVLKYADIFLFLGFNLTKWYIPLLIRKLYKIAENERVSSYATLDDTLCAYSQLCEMKPDKLDTAINMLAAAATAGDAENALPEEQPAITAAPRVIDGVVNNFLDRYPARFRITMDSNLEFVEKLAAGKNVVKPGIKQLAPDQIQQMLKSKEDLEKMEREGNIPLTLRTLRTHFTQWDEERKYDETVSIEQQYNQVERDFDEKKITAEERGIEIQRINNRIRALIKSIGS